MHSEKQHILIIYIINQQTWSLRKILALKLDMTFCNM